MTKKMKIIKLTVLVCILILSNIFILQKANLSKEYIVFQMKIEAENTDEIQVFFQQNGVWSEESSQRFSYIKPNQKQMIKVQLPYGTKRIRIDFGTVMQRIFLDKVSLRFYGKSLSLWDESIQIIEESQLNIEHRNQTQVVTRGDDPYVVFDVPDGFYEQYLDKWFVNINLLLKVIICLLTDILVLAIAIKSKSVMLLLRELNNNRGLIWSLSKNDFKTRYAGSYLGMVWAFIQPIVTLCLYWFVFEYGLKVGAPNEGVPFIFWLMGGLVPWFFFQEALLNSMNCFLEYSYLVKKVVFKISILPIVKIISALFVHLFFVGLLIIIGILYGFFPDKYTLQIIYYSFCTLFLVWGLSYTTASIILFFRDLGQVIGIFLQIGMWITPLMWNYLIVPDTYRFLFKLNPFFYISEGYRDSLINKVWFWERYFQTAYFWIISMLFFGFGALIFKKLKPHFSDVL